MSDFIVRTKSNRVRFNDKKSIFHHPRRQINLILLIIFLVLSAVLVWYHYFYPPQPKYPPSTSEISPTPTPLPGLFSLTKFYRASHSDNQLQIFDQNNNLVFKLYDQLSANIPDKWVSDECLIYKNQQSYGLVLKDKNQFFANPNLVSDSNCTTYSVSPDSKKIIFFGNNPVASCSGTLIDFSISSQSRYKVVSPQTKNLKLNQTVENAFWDSDSSAINVTLKDNSGKLQTKIIPL